jgi:branched-chain amino acid transport system permease protein
MPFEIYFNVAASGLLTGMVYGLMALGLSVIFGVVRVVNFAHGEMMTIAMYAALVLFAQWASIPSSAAAGRRCLLRASATCCRRAHQPVHQPPRAQPVHAAGRGRDDPGERAAHRLRARTRSNIRTAYSLRQLPSSSACCCRRVACTRRARRWWSRAALFAFFRFTLTGKAIRACADNYSARSWSAST